MSSQRMSGELAKYNTNEVKYKKLHAKPPRSHSTRAQVCPHEHQHTIAQKACRSPVANARHQHCGHTHNHICNYAHAHIHAQNPRTVSEFVRGRDVDPSLAAKGRGGAGSRLWRKIRTWGFGGKRG